MTSKIVVNNIQADAGVSTVTFASNIQGNLIGNVTGTVNSSGIATFSNGLVVSAGTTAAPSITPTGDSNTGIFFPAADTIAFAEGGVEAARLDSSGRLGIGTNNPSNLIHLYSTSDGAELLQLEIGAQPVSSEKAKIIWRATQTNGQSAKLASIGSTAVSNWGGEFQIFTKPANGTPNDTILERVRIDNAGRMTSPYQPYAIVYFIQGDVGSTNSKIGPSWTKAIPTGVISNSFSLYNSSNGRFTAPVTGLYEFGFSSDINVSSASGYINVGTFKNGSAYLYHYEDKIASAWQYIAFSDRIALNQNDYVELQAAANTGNLGFDSNTTWTQVTFRLIG